MKLRFCAGLSSALIATLLTASPATASVQPVATVDAPFSGKFGYSGDSSTIPPRHGTSIGDLAFDYYGANASVRPMIWSDTWNKPAILKVTSVRPTCGQSGSSVRVRVIIGGVEVGWVDYGHLKLAAGIANGKIVSPDTVLGTTYKWEYSASCYAVKTTAGVHTHVVLRNTANYSCWVKRSPGTTVDAGIRLGLVGGNFGGSSSNNLNRQPCPSSY